MTMAAEPLTEAQVEHALRLWIAHVLCDECGAPQEQAMLFTKDWEADLLDAMEDAVERFYGEKVPGSR
jgi:hypothetical protein